jgi:hypothetical protein
MFHKSVPYVGRDAATDCRRGLVTRLTRYVNGESKWRLISTAPFNRDLELCAASGSGSSRLPFPCRQTSNGWINADLGTRIAVEATRWRVWSE